jgi:hypothetical protein
MSALMKRDRLGNVPIKLGMTIRVFNHQSLTDRGCIQLIVGGNKNERR